MCHLIRMRSCSRAFRQVRCFLLLALGALADASSHAADLRDISDLHAGFLEPPAAARPYVWWHWMNGNIDTTGITLDLEWMHRAGLGGFQVFDVGDVPQTYVPKPVGYMTPEWNVALRHTATEAARLGLEMGIHASPGWSETGGPWVPIEQGMKKLVWSETNVASGAATRIQLKALPRASGHYQDVPNAQSAFIVSLPVPAGGQLDNAPQPARPEYVRDLAVVAFQRSRDALELSSTTVTVTSSNGSIAPEWLFDQSYTRSVLIRPDASGEAWVLLRFARPVLVGAVTLGMSKQLPTGVIETSVDGTSFEVVASMPGAPEDAVASIADSVRTFSFAQRTVRALRVQLRRVYPHGQSMWEHAAAVTPLDTYEVTELRPTSSAVNRPELKAGFALATNFESLATLSVGGDVARPNEVLDLTSRMQADGSIDWQPPPGEWTILRVGESLTGYHNQPARPDATGLEVDKLNRAHVRSYAEEYLRRIRAAIGTALGSTLDTVVVDSWEVGAHNATDSILEDFRRLRHYSPLPYLPAVAGFIMGSPEESDRFLWDYRRTLADLVASEHFGTLDDVAHENGLTLYAEAGGLGVTLDAVLNHSRVDVPMGEFWALPRTSSPLSANTGNVRIAASAAHVYGKPLVAAESFTALPDSDWWSFSPRDLKPLADVFLAAGVNKFVLHTSVHQPFADRAPGIALEVYGQLFARTQTWGEQIRPWIDYLSRCSHLLQQGTSVDDFAYFYGESAPASDAMEVARPGKSPDNSELRPALPRLPFGYSYDIVGSDAIRNHMYVENGRVRTTGGASYAGLILPETLTRLTPELLAKLQELVAAGATLVGPKPERSPSLEGGSEADESVRRLADSLWGHYDHGSHSTVHRYGKGRVIWGSRPDQIIKSLNIAPDLGIASANTARHIVFAHRRTRDTDIYFVANPSAKAETFDASFRGPPRQPELWNPESGEIAIPMYEARGGAVSVALRIPSGGSVFVLFRQPLPARPLRKSRTIETKLATVTPSCDITFPLSPLDGHTVRQAGLTSWTAASDPRVRYFSGTATYRCSMNVPRAWQDGGGRIEFDLGEVDDIAEVALNGVPLGLRWRAPYRFPVAGAVKAGVNSLVVRVTNTWTNRLIGDAQQDARDVAWTSYNPYEAHSPLRPAGLLGPIRVFALTEVAAH